MTDQPSGPPTTAVPGDEDPPARCPYCDRPFSTVRLRDLHVGEGHPEAATATEQTDYQAATDEERDDLFVYHLKIIAALVTLYAALIIVYMIVLSG